MNEITITKRTEAGFQAGDLFLGSDDFIYILTSSGSTRVGGSSVVTPPMYTAISLENGRDWSGSSSRPEEVVEGLGFFGRNMKIEIKE